LFLFSKTKILKRKAGNLPGGRQVAPKKNNFEKNTFAF
jgi:hypothetical protein